MITTIILDLFLIDAIVEKEFCSSSYRNLTQLNLQEETDGLIVIRLRLRTSNEQSGEHHESTYVQHGADPAHRWRPHAGDPRRERHLRDAAERLVVHRVFRGRTAGSVALSQERRLVGQPRRLPHGHRRDGSHRRSVHTPVCTGARAPDRSHHSLRVSRHRLRRRCLPEKRRELGGLPAHRAHHSHLR